MVDEVYVLILVVEHLLLLFQLQFQHQYFQEGIGHSGDGVTILEWLVSIGGCLVVFEVVEGEATPHGLKSQGFVANALDLDLPLVESARGIG